MFEHMNGLLASLVLAVLAAVAFSDLISASAASRYSLNDIMMASNICSSSFVIAQSLSNICWTAEFWAVCLYMIIYQGIC